MKNSTDTLHIFVKFNNEKLLVNNVSTTTIEEHLKVANEKGRLIYGHGTKKSKLNGLGSASKSLIQQQLDTGVPTYIFYSFMDQSKRKIYYANLLSVFDRGEIVQGDPLLEYVPSYYSKKIGSKDDLNYVLFETDTLLELDESMYPYILHFNKTTPTPVLDIKKTTTSLFYIKLANRLNEILISSKNIVLIENKNEILENINALLKYKYSDFNYYKNIIKKGVCFVAHTENGTTSFAPSRFVGYKGNSKEIHNINLNKDGGKSNVAIRRILGEETIDDELDRAFINYCNENGIMAENKARRYWHIINENPETIIEDIQDLQKVESTTERERLTLARVGQGKFRDDLIKYWRSCAVTGCKTVELLRASHIKPWRSSTNNERLDPFNGLLLIPNLDTLFDKGYISFSKEGSIIISTCLQKEEIVRLGINENMKINLNPAHHIFMDYHREHLLKPQNIKTKITH